MLDEIEPREFNEWLAAEIVEPDPVCVLIEVMKLGFTAMCNGWGGTFKPSDFDPTASEEERGGPQDTSPNQAAAIAATSLGKPHNTR